MPLHCSSRLSDPYRLTPPNRCFRRKVASLDRSEQWPTSSDLKGVVAAIYLDLKLHTPNMSGTASSTNLFRRLSWQAAIPLEIRLADGEPGAGSGADKYYVSWHLDTETFRP